MYCNYNSTELPESDREWGRGFQTRGASGDDGVGIFIFVANYSNGTQDEEDAWMEWTLYSGATEHFTPDATAIYSYYVPA